jgi:NAD(P)H-hydrate repair Nnr-like enzyme with NAD(P)H-hydrate dehydratase domain
MELIPYWHRQTVEKPLFPDLIWNRPENRLHAGKLLIVGGNEYGFNAPANAFTEAGKAGIGTCRVILPSKLERKIGKLFPELEFASSTPSGSFARVALSELLDGAAWADGTLLAGDFGRNSETAIVLEQFIQKYQGVLTITQDAADYFTKTLDALLNRENTTLVISFAQLQKIATNARFATPFTFDMDLIRLVEALHEFTLQYQPYVIVKHLENILVAAKGEVSSTKLEDDLPIWRVKTASHAAVWWLQNTSKPFEALTTAII